MSRKEGSARVSIYALLDPRDSPPSVRYVGATRQSVDTRFSMHLSAALAEVSESPKDEWIREVIRDNEEPLFMLLERPLASQDWEAREKHWIAKYQGPLLTNIAEGGAGSPGALHTPQAKKKIGDFHRGMPLLDEHRARISQSKLGHDVSQETREKLRLFNLGKKQSEQTVRKRQATMAAKPHRHDAETLARITQARRARPPSGPLSDDVKAKLSASISSLVWITDGISTRRQASTAPIPEGWRLGRLPRN